MATRIRSWYCSVRQCWRLLAAGAGLLLASLLVQLAFAATVLQVDVDYLLKTAELVFEGEVIGSEARWNDDRTSIATHITFRVERVIKGDFAAATLELPFAGGQVGKISLDISDMDYPQLGERGIYFVESLSNPPINPLVGWSQGHFLILRDAEGVERIVGHGRAPVLGVHPSGSDAPQLNPSPFSHGVARGLNLGSPEQLPQAMDRDSFYNALQQRLGELPQTATEP